MAVPLPLQVTRCYINQKGTKTFTRSTHYQTHFYPAIFNNFAARMSWAQDGIGNRNPAVIINNSKGMDIIPLKPPPGTSVILDASESHDPDGDKLTFSWWVLPDAGTYQEEITLSNDRANRITVEVPANSAGESFHVICEVTDDGTPNLTHYRRITFEPTPSSEHEL